MWGRDRPFIKHTDGCPLFEPLSDWSVKMIDAKVLADIRAGLDQGRIIPYMGPGMLELVGPECPVPANPRALVDRLTAKVSVPHKIRHMLTAAAQFIENFKHRKTVVLGMTEAFKGSAPPSAFHRHLAELPNLPLLVHAWYDDVPQRALAGRSNWGMVQGVSQSEHYGTWVKYYRPDGSHIPHVVDNNPDVDGDGAHGQATAPDEAKGWATWLYQPLGSVNPAANFIVSDSDYVEVLTEIDIQTPIPLPIHQVRKDRHFLFVGCRFANQLERQFARQIMKRSSGQHWAVLPEPPTRNEQQFLDDQGIVRIAASLSDFADALMQTRQ